MSALNLKTILHDGGLPPAGRYGERQPRQGGALKAKETSGADRMSSKGATNKPTWHGPFMGAWNKGRQARKDGKPLSSCPYSDLRTGTGDVTFGRAFQRAWIEGWHWDKT